MKCINNSKNTSIDSSLKRETDINVCKSNSNVKNCFILRSSNTGQTLELPYECTK